MRTEWQIRDTSGALVATHIRYDLPEGKRYAWERNGKPSLDGLPASMLPLYRSEWVKRTKRMAVVTEGEKATDALRHCQVSAFGTVCGAASTPDPSRLRFLLPYRVLLWPDNDDVGQEHMQRIADILIDLGNVPRRVIWTGDIDKSDAADWVVAGRTPWADIVAGAETYTRSPKPEKREPAAASGDEGYINKIKQVLRIEDIAGSLTTLRGNSVLSGQCPLHGEQRGEAFKIWVDEQKWKCFGSCDDGGDILDFLSACMERGIDWRSG